MFVYILFVGAVQGAMTLAAVSVITPFAFRYGWSRIWRLAARVLLFSACLYICGCLGDGVFVALFNNILYSKPDSIGDFVPWLPSLQWIVEPGLGGHLTPGVSSATVMEAWAAVALPVWLAAVWCYSKARQRLNQIFDAGHERAQLALLVLAAAAPAVSVLMALPFVFGAGPDIGYARLGFKAFYCLVAGSLMLGICAAPGFVCAVLGQDRYLSARATKLWLVPSLVVSALVSLLGIILVTAISWPLSVFPAISLLTCSCLLVGIKRRAHPIARCHRTKLP
jgi:hypothetical protein